MPLMIQLQDIPVVEHLRGVVTRAVDLFEKVQDRISHSTYIYFKMCGSPVTYHEAWGMSCGLKVMNNSRGELNTSLCVLW